jgi:transcriptional regulator with XRE-family HTH domain
MGQKLRIIRVHSNLSQTELGQKVSLIHQQIELYESGGYHMTASVLDELANSQNVPFAHFFEAIPLAESASLEGGLSEIGERIPDLPTGKGRRFVKEIVRLPPQLRTRTLALIKLAAGDDDDATKPRDVADAETIE